MLKSCGSTVAPLRINTNEHARISVRYAVMEQEIKYARIGSGILSYGTSWGSEQSLLHNISIHQIDLACDRTRPCAVDEKDSMQTRGLSICVLDENEAKIGEGHAWTCRNIATSYGWLGRGGLFARLPSSSRALRIGYTFVVIPHLIIIIQSCPVFVWGLGRLGPCATPIRACLVDACSLVAGIRACAMPKQ